MESERHDNNDNYLVVSLIHATHVPTEAEAAAARGRERTRQRVIEAAADLLAREGRDAVTTRAVAVAAGVQPPAIYRLFGDKDGLLDAVAEHGFATFLAAKHVDPIPQDPIEDLRAGWDLAVEFGLDQPRAVRADVQRAHDAARRRPRSRPAWRS